MQRALMAGIIVGVCSLAGWAEEPPVAPRTDIRIGTAFAGNSWDVVGRALADVYSHELPHVLATVTTTDDLEAHVDALDQGRLELAIEDAETAYLAYSTGTHQ